MIYMDENFYRLEFFIFYYSLRIFISLSLVPRSLSLKYFFDDSFFAYALDGWCTREQGVFSHSSHDDWVILDVGFPVDRGNQIEKLIEIRSYMLCQFYI